MIHQFPFYLLIFVLFLISGGLDFSHSCSNHLPFFHFLNLANVTKGKAQSIIFYEPTNQDRLTSSLLPARQENQYFVIRRLIDVAAAFKLASRNQLYLIKIKIFHNCFIWPPLWVAPWCPITSPRYPTATSCSSHSQLPFIRTKK